MTFHIIFVHIISSSVWVADWPPFGKELPIRLTIWSLSILTICILVILRAGRSKGAGLAPMTSQNVGQDGRHGANPRWGPNPL